MTKMTTEELLAKSTALSALAMIIDYADDSEIEEITLAVTKLTREISKEVIGLTL